MPAFFTIDTFVRVFILNILHPFPFLLIALYFVALGAPSAEFTRVSFSAPVPTVVPLCASISLALWLLRALLGLDARLATSRQQRRMRWKEEVMLITGGLGGLGGLLAEVYAMRGIPVAIADVTEIDAARQKALADTGIRYWRCDIGDRKQVESMAKEIKKEVCSRAAFVPRLSYQPHFLHLSVSTPFTQPIHVTNLVDQLASTIILISATLTPLLVARSSAPQRFSSTTQPLPAASNS